MASDESIKRGERGGFRPVCEGHTAPPAVSLPADAAAVQARNRRAAMIATWCIWQGEED